MKRKTLLLMLLMALFSSGAWAQTAYHFYTATAGTAGNSSSEGYASLVDNSTSTKWCIVQSGSWTSTAYIEFYSADCIIPSQYVMTTANDNATYTGRNPKSWVIKAKANSGDEWTTIANETNNTTMQDVNYTAYTFNFPNTITTAYKYFRFEISAIQATNHGVMQLSEFHFIATTGDCGGGGGTVSETIQIGSSTSNSDYEFPVNMFYNYSLTQSIYSACEIGGAGTINSIQYQYAYSDSFSLSNIQIYMAHVSRETFSSSSDMEPYSNLSLVFSGTFSASGSGWVNINLTNPFNYNGKDNLLICFYDQTSGYPGSSYKFYYTTTSGTTSIRYRSDTYCPTINPVAANGAGEGAFSYRPNIKLNFGSYYYVISQPCDITTCSGSIYDAGGPTGNYSNNESYTRTIYPGTSGMKTQLAFTEFHTESVTYDYLEIYDGTSTSATLIGKYGGTNSPGVVKASSSNSSGALTLHWVSDVSNVYSGFAANISCAYPDFEVTASANPNAAGNVKFLTGDGGTTTDSYLPCYSYYNYNLTQQIYTPAEIGNVGTINSIAFYNGGSTKTLTEFDVYLVHTDKTAFSSANDWITVTANDRVYTGSFTMTSGQWNVVNFSTPFVYDGVRNLALIIDEHFQYSSGLACRVFTPSSGGNCSLRVYSDGTNYDPLNPSGYSGTLMTVKNQILVNPGGSLTRSFRQGASVTLIEEVTDSNYHFEDWTENGSQVSTNEVYTISNIAANHNVVANFVPNNHTLTASVNPSNSGTISDGNSNVSGNVTYNHGTSVSLTANAATGYTFQNWTIDGSTVSGASTTITMDQDHTVVANFTLNQYTVTLNVGTGGTATGGGTYNEGTTAYIEAFPDECHTFSHFIDDNNTPISGFNPAPFLVDHDMTITVVFAAITYNVSATASPSAGGTVTGGGTLDCGSSCTLTATPATNYVFDNWTENGTVVSSNASYTFTVEGDRTLVANFHLDAVSITATAYDDSNNTTGGGTISGTGSFNIGSTCTLVATPASGYHFVNWTENNMEVATTANYSFTVTTARDLVAHFTQDEYTLTLVADPVGGGTVSASPAGPYHYNDVVTVTATPNSGYIFGSWSDGGMAQHTVTITDDTELTAYFGADQTLTTYANPIEGGYVTITENQVSTIGAVEVGNPSAEGVQNVSSPYWTATSYSFEECLYLASEIGVADAYITSISYYVRSSSSASSQTDDRIEVYMKNTNRTSFSSSNSDMEAVTANDKVFDGTWHLTNTTGWVTIVLDKPFHYTGSTLMIGIHEMTQGSSNITFKFTDTQEMMGGGYSIKSVYKSDTQGDIDPTALTSLTNKINNRANVRLGFGTYHYGQSVTLTANANDGYQFVNWTENNTEVGTHGNATYTVTMDGNHAIYANFERLAKRFVTNGSWDNDNNWSPTGAPDITEDVSIEAAATIPSGVVATANEITINGGSITIQDGGQLQHNNAASSMVTVTAQNTIAGYTSADAYTNKGYELVSFPVDNLTVNSSAITGLVTSDPYDFYRFDASNDPLEWIPMTGSNSISLLQGFIYASQEGTTISVTGPVMSSATPVNSTSVAYVTANAPRFNGWALLGNPFVCNAYVSLGTGNGAGSETNFYKLNHTATYDEFVPFTNSDAVNPMGGVMFRVFNNDNIVYSRTASSGAKTGILNMDVTCVKDRATVTLDRARVRFGEGRNLEKLQFDTRHTKVYIPEGGNDFSVYYADGAGTIPVNFKAQDNGRYTLDFSTEDVGFNYLHLIDNMNGNDVDLLQTPYYAFDAKSTDFASRFTLVFATGNDNDDTFAFFNNGVWIINNDGDATLQVVDALGRMLSSESISGSTSKAINVAPGVYMLRLINGDKAKVQKIVVRR